MSFFDKTNDAMRKVHRQLARDFTVIQYEYDDDAVTNEYADGEWIESDRFTVKASIRDATLDNARTGPEGDEVTADNNIYVSADEVAVSIGTDDETRATEFVDPRTGAKYRAVNTKDEGSLLRILAYEVN